MSDWDEVLGKFDPEGLLTVDVVLEGPVDYGALDVDALVSLALDGDEGAVGEMERRGLGAPI